MSRIDSEGARAPGHECARIQSTALLCARKPMLVLALASFAALGGCATSQGVATSSGASAPMFPESKWGVSASRRVAADGDRIPKGGGRYKVGEPYQVGGRWYKPREQPDYDRVGVASWYGSDFHGRHTSNGEVYDMHALTAAHPTLPLPSYAYVTNLSNGRTILVRVNDRGPYVGDRMIDLSKASADALGLRGRGTGRVRVRYAGPAPLDGNDAREREFIASRSWNGGAPSRDIAAVEREVSAREYAALNQGGQRWAPPAPEAPVRYRPEPIRNYADAGLWSPAGYRSGQAR